MGKKRKRQKEKQRKRREKKRESNKVGDRVVRVYNKICSTLIENSEDQETPRLAIGVGEEEAATTWSFLWARMREARIFIVPNDRIDAAFVKAGEKIVEVLFGVDSFDDYVDLITGDTFAETNDMIIELANNVKPPDSDYWPFPSLWVSPSGPYPMSKVLLETAISEPVREMVGASRAGTLGWLYTSDHLGQPYITQAVALGSDEGVPALVFPTIYKPSVGWVRPGDLSPWTSQFILSFINNFGTVEEHSPSSTVRSERDRSSKKLSVPLPIPRPYYVVKLKQSTVNREEKKGQSRKSWELTYRHDVRGHYRVLVERGPLPLKGEDADKLTKRGYRIYGPRPVKAYDRRRLIQRGHALPRRDEWVAMLVIWIRSQIRGPEDAPYIPSIRVAS